MKNRVVITGLGVLAANGSNLEDFWSSLLAARSGIGLISLFDATEFPCRIAGEIKGFDPDRHLMDLQKPGRLARHTQLAIAAARMAVKDAGLDHDFPSTAGEVPIVLGISSSAFDLIERGAQGMHRRGPPGVSPLVVRSSPPQAAATALCEALKFPTKSITLSTACASGMDAVATAFNMVRSGSSDIAIAGGADAPITPLAFSTFWAAGLVSSKNEHPEKASRPFDALADSGVISEGAGIVVIENMEQALARGVHIYAEITGYSTCMDPDQSQPGAGLSMCMRSALANAGLMPNDISYLSAHGPGHPVLDVVETDAIKKVFGEKAYSMPVSSIKGCTGNPLAAGGAHQIIAGAMTLHQNTIPPTANCEHRRPECDLDYVTEGARHADLKCILVNSHGIGGGNSSMILENANA